MAQRGLAAASSVPTVGVEGFGCPWKGEEVEQHHGMGLELAADLDGLLR